MLVPIALVVMQVLQPTPQPEKSADDVLALQVMLDRAGFSPGAIDGHNGANTKKALEAFREQHTPAGTSGTDALSRYRISAEDTAGPFVDAVPGDLMQQAALPALGYTSVVELLAERFHSTPALLRRLNPPAAFQADEEIVVPNVDPMIVPPPPLAGKPARGESTAAPDQSGMASRPDVVVTVARRTSALTVKNAADQILLYAPVTTGSEHDPLPIGEWKVTAVRLAPAFHYNPELFWDADPSHTKATIRPGPNNPVGLVWVDISKPHYGLHGTPEPSKIGHTESHGCVRLTNWDALRLASLVKPGSRVVFTE
jgi:lipoprotein-anchoring transpeptidase ErfK/SrfK